MLFAGVLVHVEKVDLDQVALTKLSRVILPNDHILCIKTNVGIDVIAPTIERVWRPAFKTLPHLMFIQVCLLSAGSNLHFSVKGLEATNVPWLRGMLV